MSQDDIQDGAEDRAAEMRSEWDSMGIAEKRAVILLFAKQTGFDLEKGRGEQEEQWDSMVESVSSYFLGSVEEAEFSQEFDRVITAT